MKGTKRIRERLLLGFGMMACVAAILYPLISNFLYNRRQDKIIIEHTEKVMQMDTEWIEKEREKCVCYNQEIVQKSTVVTEATGTGPVYEGNIKWDLKEYEARLNPEGNGVMGYVIIPKIKVHLPIYHFAAEEVLDAGVGHLPESSLPVGGEGSHSVLTGHTGVAGKKIFTDLALLEMGDHFFLNILGETLVYQVDQIMIVLPYEVDELMVKEGEDLCTLVTCTPYGINSHRLLVRGRREEITEELKKMLVDGKEEGVIIEEISKEEKTDEVSFFLGQYLRALVLGGVLAMIFYVGMKKLYKIRGKKA